jgi:hypothetical protein
MTLQRYHKALNDVQAAAKTEEKVEEKQKLKQKKRNKFLFYNNQNLILELEWRF